MPSPITHRAAISTGLRPRPPVTLASSSEPPAPNSSPSTPTGTLAASFRPTSDSKPTTPLRLTDDQLDMITQAAAPLALPDRGPFLEAVAAALQGVQLGDGAVARVCAEQQRKWFTPPAGVRA